MNRWRVLVPVISMVAWSLAAGCGDDRGVADIGAAGEPPSTAGTGGEPVAGAGGVSPGGQGGSSGAPHCPTDIFAQDGKSCAGFAEGAICSDGADDPCQFGQSIVCRGGKWARQEAFPAPCGGTGGALNGGAGGVVSGGASGAAGAVGGGSANGGVGG